MHPLCNYSPCQCFPYMNQLSCISLQQRVTSNTQTRQWVGKCMEFLFTTALRNFCHRLSFIATQGPPIQHSLLCGGLAANSCMLINLNPSASGVIAFRMAGIKSGGLISSSLATSSYWSDVGSFNCRTISSYVPYKL